VRTYLTAYNLRNSSLLISFLQSKTKRSTLSVKNVRLEFHQILLVKFCLNFRFNNQKPKLYLNQSSKYLFWWPRIFDISTTTNCQRTKKKRNLIHSTIFTMILINVSGIIGEWWSATFLGVCGGG
jgi:hypothetical protein